MNKLDQSDDEQLRTIGAVCPRLLSALHHSPDAVWGELHSLESACRVFMESKTGGQDSVEATTMMNQVTALRTQISKHDLMDEQDFGKFRESVLAVQNCVETLRNKRSENKTPGNQNLKSYVFYCSNFLDSNEFSSFCRGLYGDSVKTISLPCSGKVDVPYMTKAFETGADGVVIVTCKKLECRHFEGNLRAQKRAEAVESLLEEIGMGAGRMAVIECAERGVSQVYSEIQQFLDKIKNLPQVGAQNNCTTKKEQPVA